MFDKSGFSRDLRDKKKKEANGEVKQDHEGLSKFINNVLDSEIQEFHIGWCELILGKRNLAGEMAEWGAKVFVYPLPYLGDKDLQHASAYFELRNGKHIVVEYGGYGLYDTNPFGTQNYYYFKTDYGLRFYEADFDKYVELNQRTFQLKIKKGFN